jgi:hypothetical protein
MGAWLLVKGLIGGVPAWAWKYIAIGIAFLAVYGYADRKATYRERAACEAAAQRAQVAANAQDAQAERDLRINAEKTVSQLSTQKATDEKIIEDLKVKLAGQPLNAPCYYPDVAPTGRVRSQPAGKGAGNPTNSRPAGLSPARTGPLDIRPQR